MYGTKQRLCGKLSAGRTLRPQKPAKNLSNLSLVYDWKRKKKMSIRSAVSSPHHNRHNVGIVDQRNAFHSSTFLNGIVRPITSIID